MSSYYSTKLNYLIDDINLSYFNFDLFNKQLSDLANLKKYKDKVKTLFTTIEIKYIDYTLIEKFFADGIVKKHELEAIYEKISNKIKNSLDAQISEIQTTIKKSLLFKKCVSISHRRDSSIDDSGKINYVDKVDFEFNFTKTSYREFRLTDIIPFINKLKNDFIGFCSSIFVDLTALINPKEEKYERFSTFIEKIDFSELDFLSLEDKDLVHSFLTNPNAKRIYDSYLLPEDSNLRAEVTYDKLREGLPVRKMRGVTHNGKFERFHQIYSKNTSIEDYSQIVKDNSIGAWYCSVRSENTQDIMFLIIDIDVNSYLNSFFSKQIIWDLLMEVASKIIECSLRLGFPAYPTVNFSGRYMHIIWRVKENTITDDEGYITISNFFSAALPGFSNLVKDRKSCLHDRFKFMKNLAKALCIYTIYFGNINIPIEIRKKLGIYHPRQLFKLSVFAENSLSILLDTSSMGKGVFRIFSPHPKTKLVSIPIFDVKSGKFMEDMLDYDTLIDSAKIDNVVKEIESNTPSKFEQNPASINEEHINNILSTDKLFPSLCVLLRFGSRFVLDRNENSFKWWHRYYTLSHFYESVLDKTLFFPKNIDDDPAELYKSIYSLAKNCDILNQDYVCNTIHSHLIDNSISYPILEEKLKSMQSYEFFFKLMPLVFKRNDTSELELILKEKNGLRNFFSQFRQLFLVLMETLFFVITTKNLENVSNKRILALVDLCLELDELFQIRELEIMNNNNGEIDILVKEVYLIFTFYLSIVSFLKKIHLKNRD